MQAENGDKQPRDWVGYGQDPSEGRKIVQNGHQKSRDWDRHGQNPARHKLWLKFRQAVFAKMHFLYQIHKLYSSITKVLIPS